MRAQRSRSRPLPQKLKSTKAFDRARPQTETKDKHARYYAVNDYPSGATATKVKFKDNAGRKYRIGPSLGHGLQRLYVSLPKDGVWYAHVRAGQTMDLYSVSDSAIHLSPTLAFLGLSNDQRQRRGYIDVKGWWWRE